MQDAQEVSFESAMSQLEDVVRRLEKGDLTLEEALRSFQEGVKLVRICSQRLQSAEDQVELLLQQLGGTLPDEGD